MNRSQKLAIWYSYREKEERMREDFMRKMGILSEYRSSGYKSPLYFFRKKGLYIDYQEYRRRG